MVYDKLVAKVNNNGISGLNQISKRKLVIETKISDASGLVKENRL